MASSLVKSELIFQNIPKILDNLINDPVVEATGARDSIY